MTRRAALYAVVFTLTFGVLLVLACGAAAAAGPGQPVVELQQNGANDITYRSQFYTTPITGTGADPVQSYKFQRQREGRYFTYAIGNLLPSTYYAVELSFVEHDFATPGQRVFNVYVQGGQVIGNLDLCATVGANAAYQRTFYNMTSPTGVLSVCMRSDQAGGKDYGTISTIRLYRVGVNTVEISAWEDRLDQTPPVRFTGTAGQDVYETMLGKLGARFSLNLAPQRLAARFSPLGDGTGDLADLVLALSDGATVRALPFTDRYPAWENIAQSQTMTSQTFACSTGAMPLSASVKVSAPFYPGDQKISGAPFFYVDVTVTNNSAAPVSPTFFLARPHSRDFATSAVTSFATGTESGITNAAAYNYYDESYNPFKARSAVEALAVPAGEAADVSFRGALQAEFEGFTSDNLWGYASPVGYPMTYNDFQHPTFAFYPRGYTGAVWSITDLAPGASTTKHFVLAGHVDGHVLNVSNSAYADPTFRFAYRQQFANVGEVATYAVTSRWAGDAIEDKTAFFDSTISSDSYLTLPAAYRQDTRDLIACGFQSFMANTWWAHSDAGRDWFSVWEGSSCRFHGTIDVEYNHAWFYFSYWPSLLKTVMSEWVLYKKYCQQGTYLSHDMGVGDEATGQAYPVNMAVEENADFILLLYKYWKTTGDLAYLQSQWPTVKQLVDFMANCDDNDNGLPDLYTQNTLDQSSLALQRAKDQTYLGTKCMGAYEAAREMALRLPSPDLPAAGQCLGQVALINQTLEYDMWLSDHFAVCSDQDMAPEDMYAYSIYPSNGLVYLLGATRTLGVTSANISRFATDVLNATERTLKQYGCPHSTYDAYNEWVSQNVWRDMAACLLGVNLHGDNPLAMATRYWSLEKYFGKSMNGTFWDVVVYPGGSAAGASAELTPWNAAAGAGRGAPRLPLPSGGATTTYSQSLGYYPRGATAIGLIDAVAGLTLDTSVNALFYWPTTGPLRVPVLSRADWANADPAARVPTMYFAGPGAEPVITNRLLLPAFVAARNMLDITGMTAGSHAISPNGDGVDDSVTVSYSLPVPARVTAIIWDGDTLVKSYPEANLPAGQNTLTWDGKNASGVPVGDGTYTVLLDARSNYDGFEIRPASAPVYVNATVPDLAKTWYLAEGFTGHNATGGEFEEYVLVQNPNGQAANITMTFMMPGGRTESRSYAVAPNSRFTVTVDHILPDTEVSTFVSSDVPIGVERAMYFSGRKAGHASIGVSQPSKTWYLAEGYTADNFDEYVLIQNPGDANAAITATFMTPGAGNETRTYTVGAHSRFTIHVDDIIPAQSVSTQVDSSVPVVVERAQYLNNMRAGTASIGACSTSRTWYLAEGYTDQGFEEYVLIQNPQTTYNAVAVTFMERNGTNTLKQYLLPPQSRFTIGVDNYLPASEVSVKVRSQSPVLVERAMYWNNRSDGHDCIGTPTPDNLWYLPEGYTAQGFETWVLLQNPGDAARNVTVTFMRSDGQNTTMTYQVPARSRFTISMDEILPDVEASTRVESDGPLIVERAMYFDNRNGGTDSLGVR